MMIMVLATVLASGMFIQTAYADPSSPAFTGVYADSFGYMYYAARVVLPYPISRPMIYSVTAVIYDSPSLIISMYAGEVVLSYMVGGYADVMYLIGH